jgi:hypothetical protein
MRGLHHFQTLIAAEDRLYVDARSTHSGSERPFCALGVRVADPPAQGAAHAKPSDFGLILLREPRLWFNIVKVALFAALGLVPT